MYLRYNTILPEVTVYRSNTLGTLGEQKTKTKPIQLPPSVFQTAGATSEGQKHACERSWRDSSWKWTLSVPPAESRLSKSPDTPSTLAQIPCIIQCCSSHMDVAAAQQRASGHRLVLWNHMPGLVILPQGNIKWKSKALMAHIYTKRIVWASVCRQARNQFEWSPA